MKRRKTALILSLCLLSSVCGCDSTADTDSASTAESGSDRVTSSADSAGDSAEESDETGWEDLEYDELSEPVIGFSGDDFQLYPFDLRYEKMQEDYPDKTILVWASTSSVRYENEINEYLTENGSDYVICFSDIYNRHFKTNTDENYQYISSYSQLLQADIADGAQFDIIDTAEAVSGLDSYTNGYRYFVSLGLLEPIDEYLQETECGKETYDFYPENYWTSLTVDGSIYGMDTTASCLKGDMGFKINSEIVDSNGVNLDDFSGSYYEILEKIYNYCKENDYVMTNGSIWGYNYFDCPALTTGVYIDENGEAKNVYERDDMKELLNFIGDGYKSGTIAGCYSDSISDIGEYFAAGDTQTLSSDYFQSGLKTDEESGLSCLAGSVSAYRVYQRTDAGNEIYSASAAVGVCSASENKELAFEALCEVLGNKELNDLLCYGEDLEYKDGCVIPSGYSNTAVTGANSYVRTPVYGSESADNAELLMSALENLEMSEYWDFYFDTSEISEQIFAVENVFSSAETTGDGDSYSTVAKDADEEFPSEEYSDGEEYLTLLNERLYDAGLQDILDEANRQLDEWRKNK